MAKRGPRNPAINKKMSQEIFLEAARLHRGHIGLACESAQIRRTTYYNWMKTDPGFAEEMTEITTYLVDHAEHELHNHISAGNLKAVMFFLDRKARDRGYGNVTRQEISGVSGHPVSIDVQKQLENLSREDLEQLQALAKKLQNDSKDLKGDSGD